MIVLKDYQQRVLDSLRDFLRQCARDGRPEEAFKLAQVRNGLYPVPYLSVSAAGLKPDMPYVCLRVPTGGGKTLIACPTDDQQISALLHDARAVVQ